MEVGEELSGELEIQVWVCEVAGGKTLGLGQA